MSYSRDPEKEAETEVVKDFEDVLHHVGGWGRYQVLTTI
jgi:hypothetical protein